MSNTSIEWSQKVWNPVTGCTKVSEGCKNCYAEHFAIKFQEEYQNGNTKMIKYRNGFKITLHPDKLEDPLKVKKPSTFFVNSMSDLYHKDIPDDFILKVFDVMNKAHQHTFQILTKRPERLSELKPKLNWTPNIWQGVTVESDRHVGRIDLLRRCGAHVKFLSCEPLLTAIPNMDLSDIGWVIAGGESGPNFRPMNTDWVRDIRDQCIKNNVAFFFKQYACEHKRNQSRALDGIEWSEYPNVPLSPNRQTLAQIVLTINKPIIKPRVTTKHTLPIAKVKKMVPANKIQRFGGAK